MIRTRNLADSTTFQSHEVAEDNEVAQKASITDLAAPTGAAGIGTASGVTLQHTLDLLSGGTDTLKEIWLNDYYPNNTSTDDDAIDNLFGLINAGTIGDCVIKFQPGAGRGPSGRYVLTKQHQTIGIFRLVLDFGAATIRYSDPTACWRFTEVPSNVQNIAAKPTYFIMRGGTHQYAVPNVARIGWWDMAYSPSRVCGTGYAENMRIIPQVNSSTPQQTCLAAFTIKHTWYFAANQVHYVGPPSVVPIAGTCFIEQQGVCIVTSIDLGTEINYVDVVVKWGYGTMLGMEGTFTSNFFSYSKIIRQGTSTAMLVRNDGAYGWTYSCTELTGPFVPGPVDLIDSLGNVYGGFTITSCAVYYQPCEALNYSGGSTTVASNYLVNYTAPALTVNMLDIQLSDSHCACLNGVIKANGIDCLMVTGMNILTVPDVNPNYCAFDINNATMVNIVGCTSDTNSGHTLGTANYTFARLRNTGGGCVSNNCVAHYDIPTDTDNTVKNFTISGNSCPNNKLSGPLKNTGIRYKGAAAVTLTQTQGLRFYNNGSMGIGIDMDDPTVTASAAIVCTASSGTIQGYAGYLNYTKTGSLYAATGSVVVSNRGTASGNIIVQIPPIPGSQGLNQFQSGVYPVSCVVRDPTDNNPIDVFPALFDGDANTLTIYGSLNSSSPTNAFYLSNQLGNWTYHFFFTTMMIIN